MVNFIDRAKDIMNLVEFKDKWFATLHICVMWILTVSLSLLIIYHDPIKLVGSFIIFKIVERLGLYVGLHMWVSHNIVNPTGLYKIAICAAMLISNIGRASFFAKYHTIHHQYVDTIKDPHSPKFMNKWYLIFGLYPLTMYKYNQFAIPKIYGTSPMLQFIDQHYYKILSAIFGIGLWCSVQYTFYFVMIPMLLCNINNNIFFVYYLHRNGKSRNDRWINYWIPDKGGEHRTHHMVGKYIEHNL